MRRKRNAEKFQSNIEGEDPSAEKEEMIHPDIQMGIARTALAIKKEVDKEENKLGNMTGGT